MRSEELKLSGDLLVVFGRILIESIFHNLIPDNLCQQLAEAAVQRPDELCEVVGQPGQGLQRRVVVGTDTGDRALHRAEHSHVVRHLLLVQG